MPWALGWPNSLKYDDMFVFASSGLREKPLGASASVINLTECHPPWIAVKKGRGFIVSLKRIRCEAA
jgi:hypothetical protein